MTECAPPAAITCPVTGDTMVDALSCIDPSLLQQNVLNCGFVKVLDCMPRLIPDRLLGGDFAIADAARISYQKGTRRVQDDAGLIDHLIRNDHSSPVEMAELKFHLRLPILAMRQLIRHRTANVNEESARYSVLASDFYIPAPEDWSMNTAKNKQATDKQVLDYTVAQTLHKIVTSHNEASYRLYEALLSSGDNWEDDDQFDHITNKVFRQIATELPAISREQARMVLGVNIYTQCVWKMDLRNLLHFLKLRTDSHAQYEIRVYADAIAKVVSALFPNTMKSYVDNVIDAVRFSRTELQVLKDRLNGNVVTVGWTDRRKAEFADKLKKSGLGIGVVYA